MSLAPVCQILNLFIILPILIKEKDSDLPYFLIIFLSLAVKFSLCFLGCVDGLYFHSVTVTDLVTFYMKNFTWKSTDLQYSGHPQRDGNQIVPMAPVGLLDYVAK